ncbi:MAG: hypothetical protein COA36_06670 [Desulfotalea sp.]|nr:MAG: hypothetical protein COA36_06670 [Desulfotalea sp.]
MYCPKGVIIALAMITPFFFYTHDINHMCHIESVLSTSCYDGEGEPNPAYTSFLKDQTSTSISLSLRQTSYNYFSFNPSLDKIKFIFTPTAYDHY